MKKNSFVPLAVFTGLLVGVSPSWSQAPDKAASKSKATAAAAKALPPAPAQARSVAKPNEVDRREKAAQTSANMLKKSDDTAKSVIGNTK